MPKMFGYIYRQDGKPGIYLKFETFTKQYLCKSLIFFRGEKLSKGDSLMERKYVDEKQYQNTIHVLKVLRIVLVVIGVLLLIGGIILLVMGFNSNKEPQAGWSGPQPSGVDFDSTKIIFGALMASFGFMLTFAGAVMLSFLIHKRAIMGFVAEQNRPVVEESYQAYKGVIQEAAKDISSAVSEAKVGEKIADPDKDHKFCKYCGNVLDNDAAFCEFCGKKLS